MTISSRTPEGEPQRCPICDELANVDPSYPGGDACCPRCGSLLWWFRDRLAGKAGVPPELILSTASLREMSLDSLDVVELVMELEEEFNVVMPDDAAERIDTVNDAVRFLLGMRPRGGSA